MTTTLYEGTKRVHAKPMNRGDYNVYRGWEVPADENPSDEGYLVEYVDGGRGNDSRHAGYISWSPKDVFERSYKEVKTVPGLAPHQQRVVDEHAECVDSFARAILNGERGKLPNGVTFYAVCRSGDSVEVTLYSGVSRVALLVGNVDSKGLVRCCGRTRADVAQTMAKTLLPMAEKAAGQTIEQEIKANGLTAERVTPADIEANIASEHYFTAGQGIAGRCYREVSALHSPGQLELLTFCVLVLRNGFTVTGESACASPENFDAEIGRKIARQNAVQKILPLMGYELRTKLADS